jgi:tetratricopeptide (TPR) repeat protein
VAGTELDDTPPIAEANPFLSKGCSVGRYCVLDCLGGGAMGVVYSAYDPELDRKVALKLLRADVAQGETSTLQARLLREAQAMARLQHPNVIAVHDVGTFEDRVFIAMELVEGTTLHGWLRESARSQRDVIDVFVQAGRGLGAAHAVGLVHRDFKPDNVLIGRDGRVRVGDFGLARAAGDTSAPLPASPSGARFLGGELTLTGSLLGTPAYMSPEQFLRQPTDARSDQFSFCIALYEALYGERPFRDDSLGELATNVTQGRLKDPPKDRRVPARLSKLVLRGLTTAPADRWPSMDALIEALAHDPAQARRRWLAVGGALVGVTTLLVGWRGLEHRSRVCQGAREQLVGIWDAAGRQTTHDRFAATGMPYAENAFRTVARVLDRYTEDWAAMHTQACEATRVHGAQSEELLDLRMQCLSDRRQELRAVAGLFTRADGQVVERAAQVMSGLGRIEDCANTVALKTPVRPPADPATRARLDAVRRQLADARALEGAGKYSAGLPLAQAAAAEAHAIEYRPLEAEALFRRGRLEHKTARDEAAEETLVEAAAAALAGHDDVQAARSWTELVMLIGSAPSRSAEAHRWELIADASVARAGGDELRGDLAFARSNVFYTQGKYDLALGADQRSLAFYERALGPDDPRVPRVLTGLGADLGSMGRSDEALTYYDRALTLFEQQLGPDHPDVALPLLNSALMLSDRGRFDESLIRLRRALDIRERALGRDHPRVAAALCSLAEVLERLGRYDEATAAARRALTIFEAGSGPDSDDVAWALNRIGEIRLEEGAFADALAQYRRSLPMWEKAFGPDGTKVAYALTGMGRALIGLRDARGAIPPLERARKLRERSPGEPMLVATTDFALARALYEAGGDRVRARALAEEARAGYRNVGPGWRKQLAEVEAWLGRTR